MTEILASWHPFVVHFAVALTIASVFFDVIDFLRSNTTFERTGFALMLTAVPCLLLAVLTGNLAHGFVEGARETAILEKHQTYANIAVWVFTAAALWRVFLHFKGRFHGGRRAAYIFIVAAAAMSVFLAARKGGEVRHPPYPERSRTETTGKKP